MQFKPDLLEQESHLNVSDSVQICSSAMSAIDNEHSTYPLIPLKYE